MEIDTTNKFLVCGRGDGLIVGNLIMPLSPDDALLLAA